MKRRKFITLLGASAAAWPLAVWAQQPDGMWRIGVLMGYAESDPEAQTNITAFRQELQKLGWIEGQKISIDTRWAPPDNPEERQRFAKELVALHPDLILSHTTPTTAVLLQETRTIPIVFANVSDPIGSGFVTSLSRPAGNVTGFTTIEDSLGGKWLELLKEIAPHIKRVAFLFNPERQHMLDITWTSSKLPVPVSPWRQPQHLFTTSPRSTPSLPHCKASRMVALS